MAKPLDLAFYNPDQLEDRDFLDGFVARRDLADKILGRLAEVRLRGLAHHRLLVGQRGMGKTSLLRRIALGVRDQPALAAVLLPLRFREEQYNVHNLHIFWCNCLDSFGDWLETVGRKDDAQNLDREVAALNSREDDEHGSQALALFRQWMKQEGKRPLLLLDNFDIILAGLKGKNTPWSFRRVLQEADGPVIVGASVTPLEAAVDRESAFYDFFQVEILAKPEHHEILLCLRNMARQRQEGGKKVLQILDRDPARIHVLYDLTGGNPRTLAMLYLVLETSGDDGVMRDLERLLDQATPLYKARVEELAPQARVVFDALALAWDPKTASMLAESSGLDVNSLSTQLDRLYKDGLVEKVTLPSTPRTAFQVAERFFNIWYLMRHGPRRQRQRLRWLTEMLRQIYSPRELRVRAMSLLGGQGDERHRRVDYCLALSDAISERELRNALLGALKRHGVESESNIEDGVTPDTVEGKRAAVAEVVKTYRAALERDPSDPGLWFGLGCLLWTQGSLGTAEKAFQKVIELQPNYALAWFEDGDAASFSSSQSGQGGAAGSQATEIDFETAPPWNRLGLLLMIQGRSKEAEAALRKGVSIDPEDDAAWHNLGLLQEHEFGRHVEAEAAFRSALRIAPHEARSQSSLAYLLLSQPSRVSEAERFYQEAIAHLPPFEASALRSFHALAHDNLGSARKEVRFILGQEQGTFFHFLRVVALAAKRGHGEALLSWFQESDLGGRFWPLYAACEAFIHGEVRLQEINPEVRSAASKILETMKGWAENFPEAPTKPTEKRRPSSKKRAN